MLSGVEFGGVLNETDSKVRQLRAELAEYDKAIAECRWILLAQERLDHQLADRAKLAERLNGIVDEQRVPLAPEGLT